MMHAMTDDSARHRGVDTDQPLTERLQRMAWLLRDLPASAVATFAVLSVVEQGPHPGCAGVRCAIPRRRGLRTPPPCSLIRLALMHKRLCMSASGTFPA